MLTIIIIHIYIITIIITQDKTKTWCRKIPDTIEVYQVVRLVQRLPEKGSVTHGEGHVLVCGHRAMVRVGVNNIESRL